MKTISTLLVILFCSVSVNAQKYNFVIKPKQDTIIVNNERGDCMIQYTKTAFTFDDKNIKISRDGKKLIVSDSLTQLGEVSSKKFKKVTLNDGSIYTLSSKDKRLSYEKDGKIIGDAKYSMKGNNVIVEMNVEDKDFTPFLFLSTLEQIRASKEAEDVALFVTIYANAIN